MPNALDCCRFIASSSGTVDFVVSAAVSGYQTPASAGAVNATVYRYRAESLDLTQWEIGYGAYTTAGTTLARTTVIANSSGTTSKISFTNAPQVAVVLLSADFPTSATHVLKGLTGSRNATTATRLDISADAAVFYGPTSGVTIFVNSIASQAIDIATAGPAAGGRDQSGAFSSGATMHFYFIRKDDGTLAGIASTQLPTVGPTLPATYTSWAYATTLVMSGTNLQLVDIRGRNVYYQSKQTVLNLGTATTATAVSLTAQVPSNALDIGMGFIYDNATGGSGEYTLSIRTISGGSDLYGFALGVPSAGASAATSGGFTLPNDSQNLYYLNSSNLTRATLYVVSYSVPNGA